MNNKKLSFLFLITIGCGTTKHTANDLNPSNIQEHDLELNNHYVVINQLAHNDVYIQNACWIVYEDGAPNIRKDCGSPQKFNLECNGPQYIINNGGAPSWMGNTTHSIDCYDLVIKPILKID